jgi:hypothetical protein
MWPRIDERVRTAAPLLLAACGGMSSPASVADRFVDRYYVESDQTGAMPLSTGVAALQLREELRLTAEGRRAGGPQMSLRQVRVYYSRTSLSGEGRSRTAEYELDIRPQGGGELQRGARLELEQQKDGTWRVARFSEMQPR